MKNAIRIASIGLVVVAGLALVPTISAQQTGVVVVDMSAVFKEHPVFDGKMAQLRQQAQHVQSQIQAQGETLNKEVDQLKTMQVGSTGYKQLEADLAKKTADLEISRRDQLRELVSREARLHFNTYVEINELISSYCSQNGIQLVLRYTQPQVDEKNPQSVMQWVNSDVVFLRQNYDITQHIVEQLKRKYPNAGNPANPGSGLNSGNPNQ